MRIYISASWPDLSLARIESEHLVFGPTAALGLAAEVEDVEEIEYVAMMCAAQGSLIELSTRPESPQRRVVIAADVDDALIQEFSSEQPGGLRLSGPVKWAQVAAIHVDDPAMAPLVIEALSGKDGSADELLTEDLLWYDATERADLVAEYAH